MTNCEWLKSIEDENMVRTHFRRWWLNLSKAQEDESYDLFMWLQEEYDEDFEKLNVW